MIEQQVNYLNKTVEVNSDGYYRTVTLFRHEDVDCENLSEDDFVEMMKEDLRKAEKEYENIIHDEIIQSRKDYIAHRTKEAEEFAAKQWKTDKRRQMHIDWAIAKAETEADKLRERSLFFDFKPEVSQGIPGVCILTAESSDDHLRRCYEHHVASRWWKKGHGWIFKYQCSANSFRVSFRPWIELIMDESSTAERKHEQKELDDEILAWYGKQGTYTGD